MLNCRSAGSQALPSAHEHTPRKTPLGERPFFLSWCVYALEENAKYSFEVRKTHLLHWTKVTRENCWRQGHLGLQGSYKFLEPNFKTFSRFFYQNNTFFLQSQGYQIGDQQRPWKTQESGFSHGVLQTYSSNYRATWSYERSGNFHRPIRLTQCCTQFKPFGNKTFCFRNFYII